MPSFSNKHPSEYIKVFDDQLEIRLPDDDYHRVTIINDLSDDLDTGYEEDLHLRSDESVNEQFKQEVANMRLFHCGSII